MRKEYKICTACKQPLSIDCFRVRKTPFVDKYVVARCRKCEIAINKLQANPDRRRFREWERFQDSAKKAAKNEFQKKWRHENIEKNRAYHTKHIKKHVEKISDLYIVRNHFKGYKVKDIPPEVIDSIRQIIKVKRLIKNKKQSK